MNSPTSASEPGTALALVEVPSPNIVFCEMSLTHLWLQHGDRGHGRQLASNHNKQRGENITDAAITLPPPAAADNKPYIGQWEHRLQVSTPTRITPVHSTAACTAAA